MSESAKLNLNTETRVNAFAATQIRCDHVFYTQYIALPIEHLLFILI